MSLPSISVIFLSYKQEAYVREALRAVLTQDLPDYEVIIGDDASPDGTRRIIEEEIAAYRGRARIILLPPAPNVGVIRNFNRCVAASSGDIFVAAAGDGWNDVGMLRWAGTAVVMGNAEPEVLALGLPVTAPNSEAGVAQALRRYVL
jgi:glycosyltransferase involved in cell wall biosynthesis